ncbi:MAG TPA: hypothetical protein PLW44_19475, partial [Chitinophagales bacterium]|nr:hypothetical protein [Chitinophagales bacterium]
RYRHTKSKGKYWLSVFIMCVLFGRGTLPQTGCNVPAVLNVFKRNLSVTGLNIYSKAKLSPFIFYIIIR